MLSGNTYKASVSGYVKTLYIKEGDKVSNGTKLADIYDDSVMKLTVPFLSAEAEQIQVGSPAVLTLEDTGEELQGIVTVVSSMEETLSGGRLVKAVTVEVENPGGLTTLVQAAAAVGEASSCEPGTFCTKNGDDPQRGLVRPGKPGGGEPSGFRRSLCGQRDRPL